MAKLVTVTGTGLTGSGRENGPTIQMAAVIRPVRVMNFVRDVPGRTVFLQSDIMISPFIMDHQRHMRKFCICLR